MFTTVEFTAPLSEVTTFRTRNQQFGQLFKIEGLSPTAKKMMVWRIQYIWGTAISRGDYSLVIIWEFLKQSSYTMEINWFPFLCHIFLTQKERIQLWTTSSSMATKRKSERCGRRPEFRLRIVILTLVSIPCFVFPFGVLIWSTCR